MVVQEEEIGEEELEGELSQAELFPSRTLLDDRGLAELSCGALKP